MEEVSLGNFSLHVLTMDEALYEHLIGPRPMRILVSNNRMTTVFEVGHIEYSGTEFEGYDWIKCEPVKLP